MSDELKTETRQTAADIKKQIEEAARIEKAKTGIKESGMPLTNQLANEINASESTPANALKVEDKPEHQNGAAKGVEASKSSKGGDSLEWAKKKGINWTTNEEILSAMQESDRLYHEKRQQDKIRQAANPPQPIYQPPVAPQYAPPPPYVPPVQANQAVLANIAQTYGIPIEDAARLMPLLNDFMQVAGRQQQAELKAQIDAIRIEGEKNSMFRELSSDPVFRNPVVGEEFHRVMDEMQASDPRSFENPTAYKRAFQQAVFNIGRRNLEGRSLQEGQPLSPGNSLPLTPPRPLGNGSGGGAVEDEQGIDSQAFAKLSLADKKAELLRRGIMAPY